VFPTRYELNSYIVFRKRLVSKRLSMIVVCIPIILSCLIFQRSVVHILYSEVSVLTSITELNYYR
jgi:uncharacterized membrane protein YqhA